MPDALPPVTGGCLCGRVRYEAAPTHRDGYYCHCRMCQLAFGNTRAAYLNLRKDQVRWLQQPAYFASSKIARRGFCPDCGTPLSYVAPDGSGLAIAAFDHPEEIAPTVQWGIEAKLPYVDGIPDLPGAETMADITSATRRAPRTSWARRIRQPRAIPRVWAA